MIGFNSTNINIEYIFSDSIGMHNYATNEKMNYIFSTYLYYKYAENESSTIIKYIYGIYDKIDDVKSDNNLTNVEKLLLIHLMLMSSYNACEIFIITSLKYSNNIKFILTYKTDIDTKCIFVNNNIKNEKDNGYLKSIQSIYFNEYDIDVIDDHLFNIIDKKLQIPTTDSLPQSSNIYPDLVIINDDNLTEQEFIDLQETDSYKEIYEFANFLPYKNLYNGFVFKINFNGYEKFLYIHGNQDNYKLKNNLYNILNDLKYYIPEVIFSFEQLSYVVTSPDKYPYVTSYIENYLRYYVDNFPNPFVRLDLKFTFNSILKSDLPDYINKDSIAIEKLELYKVSENVNIFFKAYNPYLHSYLKLEYNNDSTIITNDDYDIFIDRYKNIKKYTNYLSNQIEFWDINNTFIDSNIGSIENSDFIDIQGFDTTTGLPIILYVSQNIDYESFYLRQYKVAVGGVVPINNDELLYPYTINVNNYKLDFIVNDYMDNLYEYDKLHNHIYNLSLNFDTLFKHIKSFTINDFYRDFEKVDNGNINYYIYKLGNENIYINNTNTNILPLTVLKNIINLSTESEVEINLSNLFIKNNTILNEDFHIYKSLYFNYIGMITHNYYYLLTNNNNYVNNKLNHDIVYNLYNEIKQLQLNVIYENPVAIDYTFYKIKDFFMIDTTNYIDNDIKDFLLNDVIVDHEYDLDNTNVISKEEVMSTLINEDIYKMNVTDTTDSYLISFYKFTDIIDTDNKFIIFNKVIGIDLFAYYSLYSDENDLTYSDYFINSINNFDHLITLYDINNVEFFNLSTNKLSFNTNDNNPIVLNKDLIQYKKIYQLSYSEYTKLIDNYKKFNYIYDNNEDIIYSYISYNDDYIFNANLDDIFIKE